MDGAIDGYNDLYSGSAGMTSGMQGGVKTNDIVTSIIAQPEDIDDANYRPDEGLFVFNTPRGLATHFSTKISSPTKNDFVGVVLSYDDYPGLGGAQKRASSLMTSGAGIFKNTSKYDIPIFEHVAALTVSFVAQFCTEDATILDKFKNMYHQDIIDRHGNDLPALTIPYRCIFDSDNGGLAHIAKHHWYGGGPVDYSNAETNITIRNKRRSTETTDCYPSDSVRTYITNVRELVSNIGRMVTEGSFNPTDFDLSGKTSSEKFERLMRDLSMENEFILSLQGMNGSAAAFRNSVPKMLCVSEASSGKNGTVQYGV